jgi:hypothetical protein
VASFATQGKRGKRDDKIGGRGRSNVCHPEGVALHLNLFDFFGDASGVGSFDQKDFFLATPTLELLFAADGFADYVSSYVRLRAEGANVCHPEGVALHLDLFQRRG